MELRAGYQETDVGVIPEDWRIVRLGSIGHVIRGASPRPKGDKRYYGGPVPRLMVEDVTRDGKFVTPIIDSLTVEGAKRSRPCPAGTLTIVCSGTVGVTSILAVDACIHDGFLALVNLPKGVETDFVFHLLNAQQEKFDGSATHGGVFTNLTTKILDDFEIALPPPPEQRAIAAALSDADALIASLDALIAKKRDLKQAAMQQLLTGKTRLQSFDNEWQIKRLGDYGDFKGGNGFPLRHQGNDTGDFPFLKVSDMNNEGNSMFMLNSNHWISDETRKILGVVPFPLNSIVFAKIGAAIFLERKRLLAQPSCIDNNMMAYVLKRADADPLFFYYLFLNIELKKLVSTTALPSLSGRDIAALTFEFPSLAEQRAIASVLADMDADLSALEAKREKARALKQGMMQQLLTGRIRLV